MSRNKEPIRKTRRKSQIIYVSMPPQLAQMLFDEADINTRKISDQVLHIIRKYYGVLPQAKAKA
jgi:hypothetical protein